MSTARPTSYSPPGVLEPIELLDVFELSGTTSAAAELLGLSQPTVSRRARSLANDLALQRRPAKALQALRYGETRCLKLLRRASQCHRLEAGAWRLGSSPWQQPLLSAVQPWASVPLRFRHPLAWRELLQAHTIDGAVISGLDLQQALPAAWGEQGREPDAGLKAWDDCILRPLAAQPLGLLLPPGLARLPQPWDVVAVPPQHSAPGLASLVRQQQWRCLHAPRACQEPWAWGRWLQHLKHPLLAAPSWAEILKPYLKGWRWQPWPEPCGDQLWLLALGEIWQEHALLESLPARLAIALAAIHAPAD